MQISPAPLVRASWLAFNISLFFSLFFYIFPPPPSLGRGGGERREHLNKKSAEKAWELLHKTSNPNKPSWGMTNVVVGAERGLSAVARERPARFPPPPPRVSLVVKGNKKGSCAEAACGEGCRLATRGGRKGLATTAPHAGAGLGACGEPSGVSASWGGRRLSMGARLASPSLRGGVEGSVCSPGSLPAGASVSPKPSARSLPEETPRPGDFWFVFPSPSSSPLLLVGIPES